LTATARTTKTPQTSIRYKILSTFDHAGNEERLYAHEAELLEKLGYNLTLAGAQLLGEDAARIADSVTHEQVGRLLDSEAQSDLLVSQMIKTGSWEENAGEVSRLFGCFRTGYREASLARRLD
jgi:predicted nucleotidyltransferase